MKYLILLSAIFCFNCFANETQKFVEINKTLFYIEAESWINYLRLLKNEDDIPPFYRYKEPSRVKKRILKQYNISNYDKNISIQLNKLLTFGELKSGNKVLSNPFIVKMLLTLDYNYIELTNLEQLKGAIHPRLKPLILSVYNLLGYEKLMNIEFELYKKYAKQQSETSQILSASNTIIDTDKQNLNLNKIEYKEKYLLSLYRRLNSISIPELREFIRIIKDEGEFLKLHQILSSYHFSIIFSLRKNEGYQMMQKRKLVLVE